MDKGGQFYIIAAVIIVLAISGIVSLSIYAITRARPLTINELSESLREEGPKIIDYGVYNSKNISALFGNFTDETFSPYFFYKARNSDIVFVYGNKSELFQVKYDIQDTGNIGVVIGDNKLKLPILDNVILRDSISVGPGEDQVVVNLAGKDYIFELQDNEMFYFVIVQENEDETYIERN